MYTNDNYDEGKTPAERDQLNHDLGDEPKYCKHDSLVSTCAPCVEIERLEQERDQLEADLVQTKSHWTEFYAQKKEIESLRAQLKAAQKSPAVAVPVGWKLVPKMLTTKMYDAIVRVADNRDFMSWPANIWENACDAAPDAPTSPRITEQDAREIIKSFDLISDDPELSFNKIFNRWLNDYGRALLDKLNEKRE